MHARLCCRSGAPLALLASLATHCLFHNAKPLHGYMAAIALPQESIDEVAGALAAAFAVLAARLRGTLHSCCMQRLHVEKVLCAPCIRPAAKAAHGAPPMFPVPAAPPRDSAAALDAAAAAYQRFVSAANAEHGSLPPPAVAISESARAACIVLLQQAQLVAAVLEEAGVPEAAEEGGETVTKRPSAEVQLGSVATAAENGGKAAGVGKLGDDSV